jgi:hypothetical protein
MAEDADPNDPKNQAAAQIGDPNAGPGEPGHYTAPDPNAGITRTPSNEIRPPRIIAEAERIPGQPEAEYTAQADDYDYESHTVPELRELADKRGIEIKSDARKDEIIEALKAG